jgi:hypothetical protein
MTYVTCLAAARNELLARRGWKVEEQGLFGAPTIRILTSTAQHSSFARAIRLSGARTVAGRLPPGGPQRPTPGRRIAPSSDCRFFGSDDVLL